mmetsp:Transcript_3609/g.7980  ORF Transcript_3609/g.7980 Transcript_3609/m.7980 type:complete len:508 (+) Transcript_3609:85-1608(+)
MASTAGGSRDCQKKHYPQHKEVCRQLGASFVGVEAVDSGTDLGRVAVAKQDFSAGAIVLAEAPAIVFEEKNSYIDLFIKYLDAPKQIQESILDLQHSLPPPTPYEGFSLQYRDLQIEQEMTQLEHKEKHMLTMDIARKLVNISELNAFSYVPGGGSQVQVNGGDEKSALYVLASKVEHSCAPNVTSDITQLGMVEYQAQIPLNEGERITYSYMSDIYRHPRSDRRGFLESNKNFTCHCKRCSWFDECNPFKCPGCGEQAMFEGGGSGRYKESTYYCLSCKKEVSDSNESILSQIAMCANFESGLAEVQEMLQMGDLDMAKETCLMIYEDIAAYHTSQLHWLYPTVWKLASETYASLACMFMQNQDMSPDHPTVAECLRMSGYLLLLEAKWTEQTISVIRGWTNIKDAAIERGTCHTIELNQIPPVSEVIEGLASDTTPDSAVTQSIYRAGLDLLLVRSLREDVAKLFEKYWESLKSLQDLNEGERTWIAVLIKSKGGDNRFPNHLMV